MAARDQHIVVSYDIHDPKRLARVAKNMKDYGERVLYSVFECNLSMEGFERMKESVEQIIDHMEDSVRYYFLCGKCIENVEISGLGESFTEEDSFSIT
ncbi:MAG: CRISPR-associated endonuclease Cas2 [Deltaproteobacteria bacterium]|nr:CRISPR-associated endonuclease Cas2 [Deltaproteobacteria bacterium]